MSWNGNDYGAVNGRGYDNGDFWETRQPAGIKTFGREVVNPPETAADASELQRAA